MAGRSRPLLARYSRGGRSAGEGRPGGTDGRLGGEQGSPGPPGFPLCLDGAEKEGGPVTPCRREGWGGGRGGQGGRGGEEWGEENRLPGGDAFAGGHSGA